MKKDEKKVAKSVKLSEKQRKKETKEASRVGLFARAKSLGSKILPPKRYRAVGLAVIAIFLAGFIGYQFGHSAGEVDGIAAYKDAQCQKSFFCQMRKKWNASLKQALEAANVSADHEKLAQALDK